MIIVPKRELILPKSVRRKQGGFLLNPFRFGGGGGGGGWVTTAALTGSGSSVGWSGHTLRQVIPATAFAAGSRIRFRIVSGTTGGMVIGAAYFGKKGVGNYDFDTTPSQLLFSGSAGVSVPAGGSVYTDELILPVTAGIHLVSMYFSGATTLRTSVVATGWFPYYKNASDASTVTASGYTPGGADFSWSVLGVEVWQP